MSFARRGRFSRPRKRLDWGGAEIIVSIFAGTVSYAWIYRPEDARELTSPTVLAMRSFVQMRVIGTPVLGGFAGIGVIRWDGILSTDTLTVPPNPIEDFDLDWMARWIAPIPDGTTSGTVLSPNIFDNTHLTKAKRKLENTSGLLWVAAVDLALAPAAISFASDHRFLVQQV